MRSLIASVSVFLASLGVATGSLWAQSVPANFAQNDYVSINGGSVTAMAWAKDGADDLLFVTQRGGQLRVVKNGVVQAGNVTSLSVVTGAGEAGLDNVIIDPGYSSNKFIYVFACQDIGSGTYRHRIYRFTISNGGTVGISAGPTQIGPESPCKNVNHNGGGMAIGADNHLYWGTGNLGNSNTATGMDGNTDPVEGEWVSLGSKIIRVNLANPSSPPTDNPWFNDPAHTSPNIKWAFAKGFRNPFGLRIRPGTSQLWLTEVGDTYEQIYVVPSGGDQKWNNSVNHNENNTNPANGLVPVLAYQTNVHPYGGCLTRGAFYTGSMFPAGAGPAGFSNTFFFVDYNSGKLMRAVLNASNDGFASHAEFVTGNSGLTDVNVGPDGALYYSEVGGTIRRLTYTGSTPQSLTVSTSSMTINEGGNGTFMVRLAIAPPGNVTVAVARTAGDTDISVSGGASLTFTTGNWNVNQTVTIHAAEDADMTNDTATITVSSASLTSKTVAVTATDNDTVNGAPTATITSPTNGATISGASSEFFGQGNDPQGNATLNRADFYVDGVLRYTDLYDPAVGHFHFDGEHLGFNTTAYSDGSHTLRMTVFDNGGLSGSAQVTVTINNSAGAQGLRADYYGDMTLTNWVLSRVDPNVDFDWGNGSPDAILPSDGFSVRWTGQVVPNFSEMYTFFTTSDDGARLWVNGTLLLDHWVNQSPIEWSGSIALTAGVPASVVYEYYENGGGALAQLSWSSPSQSKGVIGNGAMTTTSASGPPAGPGGSGGGGAAPLVSGGGGGGGGCGLVGLEAAILAIALQRRRRRLSGRA